MSKETKDKSEETPAVATTEPAQEVLFKCIVLKQADRPTITIGSMICGAGAIAYLPETKAKAAEKSGWVQIQGLA